MRDTAGVVEAGTVGPPGGGVDSDTSIGVPISPGNGMGLRTSPCGAIGRCKISEGLSSTGATGAVGKGAIAGFGIGAGSFFADSTDSDGALSAGS